jgi:hypothetical protein
MSLDHALERAAERTSISPEELRTIKRTLKKMSLPDGDHYLPYRDGIITVQTKKGKNWITTVLKREWNPSGTSIAVEYAMAAKSDPMNKLGAAYDSAHIPQMKVGYAQYPVMHRRQSQEGWSPIMLGGAGTALGLGSNLVRGFGAKHEARAQLGKKLLEGGDIAEDLADNPLFDAADTKRMAQLGDDIKKLRGLDDAIDPKALQAFNKMLGKTETFGNVIKNLGRLGVAGGIGMAGYGGYKAIAGDGNR